ncbi:MAG: hypothetical protein ACKVJU_09935 [Verrucomicrobiales bacterium]
MAEAKKIEPAVETPIVKIVKPAPAIIASSPTSEEKIAALKTEKADLAKLAKSEEKKETPDPTKSEKFSPIPYFTLFTETAKDTGETNPDPSIEPTVPGE